MSKSTLIVQAVHELRLGKDTIPSGQALTTAQLRDLQKDKSGYDRLVATGVVAETRAAVVQQSPKPKTYTDEEVAARIYALDPKNDDNWTKAGLPSATALDIKSDQRDRVWATLPKDDAGNLLPQGAGELNLAGTKE